MTFLMSNLPKRKVLNGDVAQQVRGKHSAPVVERGLSATLAFG
jgi:hypothetical protein